LTTARSGGTNAVVDVVAAVEAVPDGEVVGVAVVGGAVVAGSEELVETLVVVLAASLSVPRFWLSEARSSREQPETVGARPARRSQRPLLRRNVLRSIPLMATSVTERASAIESRSLATRPFEPP
jgi:hypothetical protein